ncbi:hypothetical protein HYPSUDRAFT_567432 [Hypholoma sublateritium FD-334 SS-4]|uniref:Uncharacterized protein n=1 Tax=Hypholoma sublateritium (strain FD-334 SS-4) TaxID=945553 RepID=A0A0D2KFX6_HYPSF|nr:hypothetical protein HYPSUDRAFT_567432 [Hypholoma sublateritium FD-334 SS-4]
MEGDRDTAVGRAPCGPDRSDMRPAVRVLDFQMLGISAACGCTYSYILQHIGLRHGSRTSNRRSRGERAESCTRWIRCSRSLFKVYVRAYGY